MLAARFFAGVPLIDADDPRPAEGPSLGASRADLRAGLAYNLGIPLELSLDLRWSPYGMALPGGRYAFAQRGMAEFAVAWFTMPLRERDELGLWTGGYAELRVAGELWATGNSDAFPFPTQAHFSLGYRHPISTGTCFSLGLGWGINATPQALDNGPLVLIGVTLDPAWGRGPRDRESKGPNPR